MATSTIKDPKSGESKDPKSDQPKEEQAPIKKPTLKSKNGNGSGSLSLTKSEIRMAVDNPFDTPLRLFTPTFAFTDILDLKKSTSKLDSVASEALRVVKAEFKEVDPSDD